MPSRVYDTEMGTLYVVATPIGCLEDLSDRARRVLSEVQAVVCEDTRVAKRLLSAIDLSCRTIRFDEHSGPKEVQGILRLLKDGKSLALTCDAGTPGINDPGTTLVRAAHQEGIRVAPVPGASALSALISVSGISGKSIWFRGFFPRKSKEQRLEVEQVMAQNEEVVFVWLESPLRVEKCIGILKEQFPDEMICVAKEMTKIYEKLFWGSVKKVFKDVSEELEKVGKKGEWCIALARSASRESDRKVLTSDVLMKKVLESYLSLGVAPSQAAKAVSQVFGVSRKQAYQAAHVKKSDK